MASVKGKDLTKALPRSAPGLCYLSDSNLLWLLSSCLPTLSHYGLPAVSWTYRACSIVVYSLLFTSFASSVSFGSLFKCHHLRKTFPVHSRKLSPLSLYFSPCTYYLIYLMCYLFFCLLFLGPKGKIFSLFSLLMCVQCIEWCLANKKWSIFHYSLNEWIKSSILHHGGKSGLWRQRTCIKFQLHHSVVEWPCASYLTSLNLSFQIYKMMMIVSIL